MSNPHHYEFLIRAHRTKAGEGITVSATALPVVGGRFFRIGA